MKKLPLLLALCLLLTAAACAKEDKQAFSSVDHDKDGFIIFEEMVFVYPDLTVENFAAYDANQDGVLDKDEYEIFRKEVVTDKKPPRVARFSPSPARPTTQTPAAQPDITVTVEQETPPAKPAPAQTPIPAKPKAPERKESSQYTIQRGDNLTKIAKKNNVSVEDILKANDGLSADTIRDGQVITIPAR